MRLYNKGKRTIVHDESKKEGAACTPGALFSVSDKLGARLKKAYPKELECLDDAKKKFADAPKAEAAPKAEKSDDEILADLEAEEAAKGG